MTIPELMRKQGLSYRHAVAWMETGEQMAVRSSDLDMRQKAEALSRRFHKAYERLAPEYGYKTRTAIAVPWEQVPEQNKNLMIAVCAELLPHDKAEPRRVAELAQSPGSALNKEKP